MQKKNTFSSLTIPHFALLAMVLLAIVIMFLISKYFDYRIKMLRYRGSENAAVSAIWTDPYQDIHGPDQPMLTIINPAPI
jgi:hypothetical protein